MRLDQKIAVITGATSGIGAAIAVAFAQEGARLVLNGRRASLDSELVAQLEETGATFDYVSADVAKAADAASIADFVSQRYGVLDVLVLNAGVISLGPFWELSEEQFDEMMAVNVRGMWLTARACEPLLAEGSAIVGLGSVCSYVVPAGESMYSATKGAALQLVRGMAIDLAPRGIRANALCPGAIGEAGMTQNDIDASDDPVALEKMYESVIPLSRLGSLRDVAAAAVYLASDDSSYVTGTSLVVDGGYMIQ